MIKGTAREMAINMLSIISAELPEENGDAALTIELLDALAVTSAAIVAAAGGNARDLFELTFGEAIDVATAPNTADDEVERKSLPFA